MGEPTGTFVPAAGHNWALPLYDPLARVLGSTAAMGALLEQAELQPSQRVLDVGCGTGTLAIMIQRLHRDTEVVGLDPDPTALAQARRKAVRAGVTVRFDHGFGSALPYPDGSFDRVFSSLMLHHLAADEKAAVLREIRRVLRPGGSFHLLDFEGPEGAAGGLLSHLLHSSSRVKDNAESRILELMNQAAFSGPQKLGRRKLLVGRVAYFRAGVLPSA